jgi:hypothetical protein
MARFDCDRSVWVSVIRAEYREIPGLSLTTEQAQRLWGLDRDTCGSLLEELVQQKVLRLTSRKQYVRFD